MKLESQRKLLLHLIPGWLMGLLPAYFATSFLSNFYSSALSFILLGLSFSLFFGIIFILLSADIKVDWRDHWTTIAVFALAIYFAVSAIITSWGYPTLFDRRTLFMDSAQLPLFVGLSFISLVGIWLSQTRIRNIHETLQQKTFFIHLQKNLPGICLALIFFIGYFTLAQSLNFPNFQTLDQYFDLDISIWLQRLTTPARQDVIAVRAVHPAILIFLRPITWFISLLLHGNRLQAVFLVNALAGALCVFVFWLIVKHLNQSITYALLMASLLGFSIAHLLFSAMLETYIYSALALIVFVLIIQGENKSFVRTVPAGILVFGITITNFIQTCILYFLALPNFKTILKYILLVLSAAALLSLIQVWLYPNARSFLLPSNFLVEKHYQIELTKASWYTIGRVVLIARAILLYGIVAPTPFILTQELGAIVPNFRTFEVVIEGFHVAGYKGIADVTVKFWILIAAIAVILFLFDLFKTPRQMLFPISLLLCLGFNLVLHITYGDDPMLYSPDWVYALVLFVAFAFRNHADKKWLHLLLLIFLGLLVSSNFKLIHQILEVSLPFYG